MSAQALGRQFRPEGDETVVFSEQEGKERREHMGIFEPGHATRRLATPRHPVQMNIDGEWFVDNGQW